MSNWSGWDWISYGCLGVAALGLAVGAWGKENPEMFSSLPSIFLSPKWAALPAILFVVATVIFIARMIAPIANSPAAMSSNTTQHLPPVINEPVPLKKMFTAYDIEQRLRAIDEIYALLSGKVMDASSAGEKLNSTLAIRVANGSAIADLDQYAENTKTVMNQYFQEIARFQYFPDIYQIAFASDWNPLNIAQSSELLRAQIQEAKQHGHSDATVMNYLQNNKYLANFQSDASGRFWQWINKKQELLTRKRREYEQSPVYPK